MRVIIIASMIVVVSMILILNRVARTRRLKTAAVFADEYLALAIFKLNSGMINTILLPAQEVVKQMEDLSTLALGQVINQDMTGESGHTTGDAPDMQVMDGLDTCNLLHIDHEVCKRDMFGD